jgi:hypothetical protein
MVKEKISECTNMIRSIEGVASCALISRDGIGAGKYFDRDLNKPWLGALPASLLSSCESVGGIIKMKSLESIAIRALDTSLMVAGAGENFFISAIISERTDPSKVHGRMLEITRTIGESI